MIVKKEYEIKKEIKLDIPLGYEYDSDTKSIVLLKGYMYEVTYNKTKVKDIIDLRVDSGEVVYE